MLTSLAEAHAGGEAVDWRAFLPADTRTDLPTYAFQRPAVLAGAARPDR